MIGYHPAVGQINILLELDGDYFRIDLDDSAQQPIAHPHALIILVITVDVYQITNFVRFPLIGSACEINVGQVRLLNLA